MKQMVVGALPLAGAGAEAEANRTFCPGSGKSISGSHPIALAIGLNWLNKAGTTEVKTRACALPAAFAKIAFGCAVAAAQLQKTKNVF